MNIVFYICCYVETPAFSYNISSSVYFILMTIKTIQVCIALIHLVVHGVENIARKGKKCYFSLYLTMLSVRDPETDACWNSFGKGGNAGIFSIFHMFSNLQMINFCVCSSFCPVSLRYMLVCQPEFVLTITSTIVEGFQNDATLLFFITCRCSIWNIRSGRPGVKVTLGRSDFCLDHNSCNYVWISI